MGAQPGPRFSTGARALCDDYAALHTERDDLHRDVALAVLDRLHAEGFAALRRYAGSREVHPGTRFIPWLAVVVGNTFVDHLRALPEYQRRRISAARTLVRIEHRSLDHVANLDGGMMGWAAAGKPVTTDDGRAPSII